MEETLTLHQLGLAKDLGRSFRTTNCIENVNALVDGRTDKVTVSRVLQRHGMFLADGGQIAQTAQSDRFTTAKWEGLLDTRDLEVIQVSDFEMIEAGERFEYTGDCIRVP